MAESGEVYNLEFSDLVHWNRITVDCWSCIFVLLSSVGLFAFTTVVVKANC